jgi:hypothetical protein
MTQSFGLSCIIKSSEFALTPPAALSIAEAVKHIARTLRFAFTIVCILGFIDFWDCLNKENRVDLENRILAGDKSNLVDLASPSPFKAPLIW